jgi:hypothetical protein
MSMRMLRNHRGRQMTELQAAKHTLPWYQGTLVSWKQYDWLHGGRNRQDFKRGLIVQ